MARTDDLVAAVASLQQQVAQLQSLGASRWGAPHPATAWGEVAYAQATTTQSGIGATVTNLTSLTVTFTALAGRKYKTTGYLPFISQNTATGAQDLYITDGSNNLKQRATNKLLAAIFAPVTIILREVPGAGSVTRKLRLSTSSGTVDSLADPAYPAFILVEDIGPA